MKKNNKILISIFFILIIIIATILIISNKQNTKGELKQISYNDVIKMKENKEDFILIVSASTCSHCMTYKPKVKQIAENYGITVFYIDYDRLSNAEDFLKEFNLTGATPMTLFFKNGKEKSVLNRIEGDLSENYIIEKFKKMGFIEK